MPLDFLHFIPEEPCFLSHLKLRGGLTMEQKGLWKGIATFLPVLIISCAFQNAYGSGFAIYTQGASALGQADAVIAHTDDPSAIFFNPALINKLE